MQIGDVHVVGALTFGFDDPIALGFDAAVEFPPHNICGPAVGAGPVSELDAGFRGYVLDYGHLVAERLATELRFPTYRTVLPSWDNTPRRGLEATVFTETSPAIPGLAACDG